MKLAGLQAGSIRETFDYDFHVAEELLSLLSEREPDIPVAHPMGAGLTYLLSRQMRSLHGILVSCEMGNDHAASVILRTVLEDFLLIWYFQEFNDAKDRWFTARGHNGRLYLQKLKDVYGSDKKISDYIQHWEEMLNEVSPKTETRWENRLRDRMDKLATKIGAKRTESKQGRRPLTTGIFQYDVLYDRFSQWVHPTGVELGRYVQHHSDDYYSMLFEPDLMLIAEVLYTAIVLVGSSFVKYLTILRMIKADVHVTDESIQEVEVWLSNRLAKLSLIQEIRNVTSEV